MSRHLRASTVTGMDERVWEVAERLLGHLRRTRGAERLTDRQVHLVEYLCRHAPADHPADILAVLAYHVVVEVEPPPTVV